MPLWPGGDGTAVLPPVRSSGRCPGGSRRKRLSQAGGRLWAEGWLCLLSTLGWEALAEGPRGRRGWLDEEEVGRLKIRNSGKMGGRRRGGALGAVCSDSWGVLRPPHQ